MLFVSNVISMIIIDDDIYKTIGDMSDFISVLEKRCQNADGLFELYMQFLHDVFEADVLLQTKVSESLPSDLISYIVLPHDVADDFSSFDFILASADGRAVRKREDMMFQQIVESVFKDVVPLYPRLISYANTH